MHFLEAARFLNALVLAEHKVNARPWFSSETPPSPTTAVRVLKKPLCSHFHKITYEPVDYMALGRYDFAAGQRQNLGHWKGWAKPTLPMVRVMSLPRIKITTVRAI